MQTEMSSVLRQSLWKRLILPCAPPHQDQTTAAIGASDNPGATSGSGPVAQAGQIIRRGFAVSPPTVEPIFVTGENPITISGSGGIAPCPIGPAARNGGDAGRGVGAADGRDVRHDAYRRDGRRHKGWSLHSGEAIPGAKSPSTVGSLAWSPGRTFRSATASAGGFASQSAGSPRASLGKRRNDLTNCVPPHRSSGATCTSEPATRCTSSTGA